MSPPRIRPHLIVTGTVLLIAGALAISRSASVNAHNASQNSVAQNAVNKVEQGEQIFRFDTFGDQAFWGDTLKLHQAIEGAGLGGVGPGVSPKTALAVGLKVDLDALPSNLVEQIEKDRVNLNDPAVTLALLKLNAVIGVTGFFNSSGTLKSVGIQCELCHSTVDNSNPALCAGQITPNPGTGCIGHRLDGWPNRDLNVGGIVALAPDLSVLADLLSTDQATVRKVLNSWGPGKYDAELNIDGKAFRPDGKPAATLNPPAFGLAGSRTGSRWQSIQPAASHGWCCDWNERVRRHLNSSSLWSWRSKPPHLDRLGFRTTLERFRSQSRNARERQVLRSSPEQRDAVPNCGRARLCGFAPH